MPASCTSKLKKTRLCLLHTPPPPPPPASAPPQPSPESTLNRLCTPSQHPSPLPSLACKLARPLPLQDDRRLSGSSSPAGASHASSYDGAGRGPHCRQHSPAFAVTNSMQSSSCFEQIRLPPPRNRLTRPVPSVARPGPGRYPRRSSPRNSPLGFALRDKFHANEAITGTKAPSTQASSALLGLVHMAAASSGRPRLRVHTFF